MESRSWEGRASIQGLPEAILLVQRPGSLKETPVFVFGKAWQLPKTCFFVVVMLSGSFWEVLVHTKCAIRI